MKASNLEIVIAYLAPEIPGASSTFVYNEILELEKLGIEIHPYSLHTVAKNSENKNIQKIANSCEYLYEKSLIAIAFGNIISIFQSPLRYFDAFGTCLLDTFRCFKQPRVAAGLLYRFFVGGSMAVSLRENGINHLHCHFSHIATDVGMYAALQTGIPFSFTAHANDIFERGYLLKEKGRRAKFIATISNYNISILSNVGIKREKLKLVRCGVDTEKFIPRKKTEPTAYMQTIGFLGRLVEKKGVDLLIFAMRKLINEGLKVRLEIMGSGPLENDLHALVVELELEEHVIFGGGLHHDQVAEWFETIDYFAFAGKKDKNGDMDGIPVVIMEAMMRGVPVIATSISGIPELVRKNETGRLAKPTSESLADEMMTLLTEPESERNRRVRRAIIVVSEEFNLAKNTKQLLTHMSVNGTDYPCPIYSHN
ncbi:glycosyltransferase [Microbulbifer bruguierae]|uniref:Glycosyltransferase n=1 Tax=Microbulbifer bruguierae TaxID=3029061 RepID=A0ABY8N8Y1_9GAMM|nr:glycosyltransferase [Microbulbifer bruguierae]WGL15253.1 glycosyltransferase [Microbulbifer bruguierae]